MRISHAAIEKLRPKALDVRGLCRPSPFESVSDGVNHVLGKEGLSIINFNLLL